MRTILWMMALLLMGSAQAAPAGLDALLKQVQESSQQMSKSNQEREQRFLRNKSEQAAELQKAENELAAAEARIARIRGRFDASQAEIKALKERLQSRVGDAGAMYAAVRQAAGDFRAVAGQSLVTAQVPGRLALLDTLARGDELPSVGDLEKFWFVLQQEMTEGGKIARFETQVVDDEGALQTAVVTRVGVFTAFSDGAYLAMQPDGRLAALARQPGHGATGLAESFEESDEEIAPIVVDPSHGTLMALEAARPTLMERVHQGGEVGYVIIFIGIVGLVLSVYQFGVLFQAERGVRAQLQRIAQPSSDNPLGRVLASLKDEKSADPEVIELHVSEAVLRETPRLERFQGLIKLIVAAGPLLGLLGTVVGMIITFQAITETGAGDPKVMAGGISQAMVATVLGLGIAIPLLFINTLLQSRSRALIQILDEQSAGMLAQRLEAVRARRS